ncbi:hypothetical protein Ppa06_70010 [Planomonospora parontospora subsp. parontospora]|uniref:Uncharacterized protein n=2 Tax=Planomonospora parontospora TaxID=58119 RepID=A0AA37BML0_9ACTN|nr:hypothetical protein [Planomonospora parontospora]GGK94045.1 hypothetical protein GCM10010126_61770 [Planomonospora parontospora]GII13203.1 hypothetical protein Ppa06_70010 [Planomonospora parontospora subsp. parontospora]
MPSEHDDDPFLHVRAEYRLGGRTCAWCGQYVAYSGRGRPASYCSKSCRNRAWEVRSAEARLQRDIAAGALRTEPVRETIREIVTENTIVVRRTKPDPIVPTAARQWIDVLAELREQLRTGELGRKHWQHAKLYDALADVVTALGEAHPGGLHPLHRAVSRRRR